MPGIPTFLTTCFSSLGLLSQHHTTNEPGPLAAGSTVIELSCFFKAEGLTDEAWLAVALLLMSEMKHRMNKKIPLLLSTPTLMDI